MDHCKCIGSQRNITVRNTVSKPKILVLALIVVLVRIPVLVLLLALPRTLVVIRRMKRSLGSSLISNLVIHFIAIPAQNTDSCSIPDLIIQFGHNLTQAPHPHHLHSRQFPRQLAQFSLPPVHLPTEYFAAHRHLMSPLVLLPPHHFHSNTDSNSSPGRSRDSNSSSVNNSNSIDNSRDSCSSRKMGSSSSSDSNTTIGVGRLGIAIITTAVAITHFGC
jgi:hypothetical protein